MTQKEHDEKASELWFQLSEAEKQIQDIRKKLDELNSVKIEPESRRWKPKEGETYYFISNLGVALSTTWTGVCHDSLMFAIGNVFETKEEAEFEVERLKVIAELKEFTESKDRSGKWLYTAHYAICYSHYAKEVQVGEYNYYTPTDILFESKERAKEAVKSVGEERIKKYYLRVKE